MVKIRTARLTPTETRIFDLLSDGERHSRKEVHCQINDELSRYVTFQMHVSNLRRKLPAGYGIVCVIHKRQHWYQLVRFLT